MQSDTVIHGFCDKRFRAIEEAFRANFEDGLEIGASLGVTWRGKMVVDLWGGWANPKKTRRWKKNTLVLVYSLTKLMVLMSVFRLVDRGQLKLDEPICRYWPEFAQRGKDKVTLRDFITHQGGVPAFVPPASFDVLIDWKQVTAHIAAQPHRFGGQKVLCYHPVTYGYVLGELIRRIDGRMPGQFFREVFAHPARADFHMGLRSWLDLLRIAETTELQTPTAEESPLNAEIIDSARFREGNPRSWKFLSANIPATLGFGNGRSVARLCAIYAMKGRLGWRRYLSQRMVAQIGEEQVYAEDLYIGMIRWGLGVGLDSKEFPAPSATSMHWGGAGGSWAMMDPATGVSVGYTPNNLQRMSDYQTDPRITRLIGTLKALLPTLPK